MDKRDLMYSGMTTKDENTCDHLMYDSNNISEHYCEKYNYQRIGSTDKTNCENYNRGGSCFLEKRAEAKEKAEKEAKEKWLATEEGQRWQTEEDEKKRKVQAEEEEKRRKVQAEEEEKRIKAQEEAVQSEKERPLRIISMILCIISSVFLFYIIYIKGLVSVKIGSVINGSIVCFLFGFSILNKSLSGKFGTGIFSAICGALLGLFLGWLAGLMGGIRIIWAIVTSLACFLPLIGGKEKRK